MEYNYQTKSLKQRLGVSESKKSIFSRIGNSTRTTGSAGISTSLKNRLNQRRTASNLNTLRKTIPERRTNNEFNQNKLLFKKAIEESTSFDRPIKSSVGFRPKNSIQTEDQPVHFRIANGTLVKGLRSDSILLRKKSGSTNMVQKRFPNSKLNKISHNRLERFPKSRIHVAHQSKLPDGKVSMSMKRELTVNIKNEQSRTRFQGHYLPKRTIQNDTISDDYMSDDSLPIMSAVSPLRMGLRKMSAHMSPVMSKVVVMQPEIVPFPQPKLHRQVLDPGTQSEIAVLQGKQKNETSGPGPGVKSFKMIPVITKKPLTERFKQDKYVA